MATGGTTSNWPWDTIETCLLFNIFISSSSLKPVPTCRRRWRSPGSSYSLAAVRTRSRASLRSHQISPEANDGLTPVFTRQSVCSQENSPAQYINDTINSCPDSGCRAFMRVHWWGQVGLAVVLLIIDCPGAQLTLFFFLIYKTFPNRRKVIAAQN